LQNNVKMTNETCQFCKGLGYYNNSEKYFTNIINFIQNPSSEFRRRRFSCKFSNIINEADNPN